MFPLTRVPFWHRFFEPQPNGSWQVDSPKQPLATEMTRTPEKAGCVTLLMLFERLHLQTKVWHPSECSGTPIGSPSRSSSTPWCQLCLHLCKAKWPWPVPRVNIPIPTKIGSNLGGAPTPKWDPIDFDHSQMMFALTLAKAAGWIGTPQKATAKFTTCS